MSKRLVIVESPAKARTIAKYLGPEFVVESSIGHIRDLPSTASEIPAEYKKEAWARLGVDVDKGFRPVYVIPRDKKTQVAKLRKQMKEASELYLATDEDREGEAIAWHLVEVLKPKVPVKRMVFDEITKRAITNAVHQTRDIDMDLVNAQEARRIIDRLYGYEVSPVLWRKVRPKLSAGRVQSVATRLVVERERARLRFVAAAYCGVSAKLEVQGDQSETVATRLVELDGQRVAIGKDFDDTTGQLKNGDGITWLDEALAESLVAKLESAAYKVMQVTEKPFTTRPYAPFITSSLQQEAARKLRFTARRTMRVAQSLYENGYITYMRTDSTNLSSQAIDAARAQATELYGKEYVPNEPRTYTRKSKNAQEAHEAIRPAGESFRTPKSLEGKLDSDALRLYELVWKRTVASQMKDAQAVRTSVRIGADAGEHGRAVFTVSGKVITFAGFLRAYVEGADDPDAELEDTEKVLPPLRKDQNLDPILVEATAHATLPPARYTEAALIRELEERGIGRPSTYASIMQTIQDRGYVWRKGSALVPTFTAFAVTNLLERHLGQLVDFDFTAKMEDGLDSIANGDRDSASWLHDFYFGQPNGNQGSDHIARIGLKALIGSGWEKIDAREVSFIPIGKDGDGRPVAVRVGRYGPYIQIGDGDDRASIPDDLPPDEITVEKATQLVAQAAQGNQVLGDDPETSKPVYLKTGRFGPYVQLGDPELTPKGNKKKGGKPKMASLWPTMSVETVTLDDALMLLSFPREVGAHPDSGEVITAQDGRFGPYLKMGAESRSLENHEQLRSVTLAQAVEILKQPKRGRGAAKQTVMFELGTHPDTDLVLQIKDGRFGPYVTDGVVNASVPKGTDPAGVTLEDAVGLIAAREQKLRDQGKDPRAPKRKKTRSTKKTTKKPAKKATKKKVAKTTSASKSASKTRKKTPSPKSLASA